MAEITTTAALTMLPTSEALRGAGIDGIAVHVTAANGQRNVKKL